MEGRKKREREWRENKKRLDRTKEEWGGPENRSTPCGS